MEPFISPSQRHTDAFDIVRGIHDFNEQHQMADAIRQDIDALTEIPAYEGNVAHFRPLLESDEETPFLWQNIVYAIADILFFQFRLEGAQPFEFAHTRAHFETYLPPVEQS